MSDFVFEIVNKNGLFSRVVIEPEGNEVDLKAGDVVTLKGSGSPVNVTCDALGTGGGNFLTIYPEVVEDFTVEINGKNFYEFL